MKEFFRNIAVGIATLLAQGVLRRYRPKIIVVTGSVGKTSTKDALAATVALGSTVWKSEKSYNTEVGVPLAILHAKNPWGNPVGWFFVYAKAIALIIFPVQYPKWLVLEVGADKPGDLQSLMRWIRPEVVVVTRLPKVSVHVAFYQSAEQVNEEESVPARLLRKEGTLILNGDDEIVRNLRDEHDGPTITYGFSPAHTISAAHAEIIYGEEKGKKEPTGMRFEARAGRETLALTIPGVIGLTHVYPVLASLALASRLSIPLRKVAAAMAGHVPPPGRMRLLPGIKGVTLIDDTYNSSPVAAEEALRALQTLKEQTGRRVIAILGDMKELGSYSDEEHQKLGKHAGGVVDFLLTVGVEARRIADGALDAYMDDGKIFQFDEAREAGKFAESLLKEGDIVLIKGSQSIRMERTVKELMAHPDQAESLLVRQDAAWQRR